MTNLKKVQQYFAELVGESFVAASDHKYWCRCDICRDWWLRMGPDPDNSVDEAFGPFRDELWEEYAEKSGMSVEDAKDRFTA